MGGEGKGNKDGAILVGKEGDGTAKTISQVTAYPIRQDETHGFWSCTGTHQRPTGTVCVCVTLCFCIIQRQKDKEGEFNGVSQGEAPLFPLIKHAGSALAP